MNGIVWFLGVVLITTMNYFVVFAQQKVQGQMVLAPGKKITLKESAFQSGKKELDVESMAILTLLSKYLTETPALEIEISGHTDNRGSPEQNLRLSSERANSIKEILVQTGISPQRIITRGYADLRPIASNDTEFGRSQNRRVEIVGLSGSFRQLLTTNDGAAIRPDGEITQLQNQVKTLAPWERDWNTANLKTPIYEFHKIQTLDRARAEVTFHDQSKLQIAENSLIVIYRSAQSLPPEGKQRENVGLVHGGLWVKLQSLQPKKDSLTVRTLVGEIQMNKAGKIDVDEKQRSLVSVHEGAAQINSELGSLNIPENFGTRADLHSAPEEPRKLPPVPTLTYPTSVFINESEQSEFRWNTAARKTRFEILESGADKQVFSTISSDTMVAVVIREGDYRIRLTGIDSIGLESKGVISHLKVRKVVVPPTFRVLEYCLLVVAAFCMWGGTLYRRNDLRFAAMALFLVALWMFWG